MSSGREYEEKLAIEPIGKLMVEMTIPTITAQLINLLYNIVDRIFIGHIPAEGTDALAGVGVASTIIILVAAFSQIVGGGAVPLAALALGGDNRERADKIIGNGFGLLVIFTVLISIGVYSNMEVLLRLTGASDSTMKYAVDYLQIYMAGTFLVMMNMGMNGFITCQGRPKIAMVSAMIGAGANIVLDPIFIFAFNMGVRGAAIATVISQACSAAWILSFLLSDRATLRIKRKNVVPDLKIIASIVALGIAPFVMASTESLIGFVLNNRLAVFGDIYVSALTIMQSAMQMISVPLAGFAQGVTPIISYNFGSRNIKRVKESFKKALIVMFSFNAAGILLIIAFPRFVAGLFTSDAQLISVVGEMMPIFLMGMTIFGLQRACQNTFVALGQAKISLFIALLRKVILLVPLAIIFPRYWGVVGVYRAEAVADATAAILCTIIFAIYFTGLIRKYSEK